MLEEEARRRPANVERLSFTDTSGWFSQNALGETHAVPRSSRYRGKDLGAHMFGPDYAELINIFSLRQLGSPVDFKSRLIAGWYAIQTGASDIGSMRIASDPPLTVIPLLHRFPKVNYDPFWLLGVGFEKKGSGTVGPDPGKASREAGAGPAVGRCRFQKPP